MAMPRPNRAMMILGGAWFGSADGSPLATEGKSLGDAGLP